jgi:hypothetical protein
MSLVQEVFIFSCHFYFSFNPFFKGLKLAAKDEIKLDANQIVIYGMSKSGEVEKAYNLLLKEVARGAPPTLARTYSNVINRLTRIGRIAEALEALNWSHSFSLPDIKSYHALLFCKSFSYAVSALPSLHNSRLQEKT